MAFQEKTAPAMFTQELKHITIGTTNTHETTQSLAIALAKPGAVERVLDKLANHNNNITVHDQLLALLYTHAQFERVAEWFITNHNTSKAAMLRSRISKNPKRGKKHWDELLLAKKILFATHEPIMPHSSEHKCIAPKKKLHPFDELLGHYCARRHEFTIVQRGKTIRCGAYHVERNLKNAIKYLKSYKKAETQNELRNAILRLKKEEIQNKEMIALWQAFDKIEPETLLVKLECLHTEYTRRCEALRACGKMFSLVMIDFILWDQLRTLTRHVEQDKTITLAMVQSLILTAEQGTYIRHSSSAYFSLASVHFDLGKCAELKDSKADPSLKVSKVAFNCSVQTSLTKETKPFEPSTFALYRDLCFSRALYYIMIAKELQSSDQDNLRNTTSLFLDEYGEDITCVVKFFKAKFEEYQPKHFGQSILRSANETVKNLISTEVTPSLSS